MDTNRPEFILVDKLYVNVAAVATVKVVQPGLWCLRLLSGQILYWEMDDATVRSTFNLPSA